MPENATKAGRAGLAPLTVPGGLAPVEWRVTPGLTDYNEAVAFMDARAQAIAAGEAGELVWLVEHPPLYTAGTGAQPGEVVDPRFPVFQTGRGGQTTYHGPGQRVGYAMLDLKRRGGDVRRYVFTLEEWIIQALARFGVVGERREDRIGVWVRRADKNKKLGEGREDKIAALGIRVKQWVTLHGIAINVTPDLGHFSGIVPCGVRDENYGVTSLADLGIATPMSEFDAALRGAFENLFGKTVDQAVGNTMKPSPAPPVANSASVASRS